MIISRLVPLENSPIRHQKQSCFFLKCACHTVTDFHNKCKLCNRVVTILFGGCSCHSGTSKTCSHVGTFFHRCGLCIRLPPPPPPFFFFFFSLLFKIYVSVSFFQNLFNIYTSPELVEGLVTCSLLPKKVLYFLACYAMIIYMCVLKNRLFSGCV